MGQSKTLNIAMIGYGFMGRAHSNAFHQATKFFDLPFKLRLKAICGRNEDNLDHMAEQWGWEQTNTDWEKVVGRKDIDVIDICTPNYLHEPIAVAAAKAGKMVLCEKPLGIQLLRPSLWLRPPRMCIPLFGSTTGGHRP